MLPYIYIYIDIDLDLYRYIYIYIVVGVFRAYFLLLNIGGLQSKSKDEARPLLLIIGRDSGTNLKKLLLLVLMIKLIGITIIISV